MSDVTTKPAAQPDQSPDISTGVPLSLPPHPRHGEYCGWAGVEQLIADASDAGEIYRQARKRYKDAEDIPEPSAWLPIQFVPSATIGQMNWTPGIVVKLRHTHPDEVNVARRGLLVNRHINPQSHFADRPLITRDAQGRDEVVNGPAVSFESFPGGQNCPPADARTVHQRDWDFLVATRNRIWAQSGITESAPVLDKLAALAEYVYDRQFLAHWGYSVHPADYLHHATYCTGRANAVMGLAQTMGLRVRSLNYAHHSMCEVLVDGQWYFIENSSFERFTVAKGSYMELTAHPDKLKTVSGQPIRNDDYSVADVAGDDPVTWGPMFLLAADWGHFNWTGGGLCIPTTFQVLENGCGVSVCLDGNAARALYPNASKYYLKEGIDSGMYTVAGKYGWFHSYITLGNGQALRRPVYFGKLNDPANPVAAVEMTVLLKAGATDKFPGYGGDMYIRVNGAVRRLEWQKLRWSAQRVKLPVSYEVGYLNNPAGVTLIEFDSIRIEIPVSSLTEDAVNTFEFGVHGTRGAGVEVMIFPDPVLPYASGYAPADQPAQTRFTVSPDHVCEVIEPGKANFHSPKPHSVPANWSGRAVTPAQFTYQDAGRAEEPAASPANSATDAAIETLSVRGRSVQRLWWENDKLLFAVTGPAALDIYAKRGPGLIGRSIFTGQADQPRQPRTAGLVPLSPEATTAAISWVASMDCSDRAKPIRPWTYNSFSDDSGKRGYGSRSGMQVHTLHSDYIYTDCIFGGIRAGKEFIRGGLGFETRAGDGFVRMRLAAPSVIFDRNDDAAAATFADFRVGVALAKLPGQADVRRGKNYLAVFAKPTTGTAKAIGLAVIYHPARFTDYVATDADGGAHLLYFTYEPRKNFGVPMAIVAGYDGDGSANSPDEWEKHVQQVAEQVDAEFQALARHS